jgi:hypothetical protein
LRDRKRHIPDVNVSIALQAFQKSHVIAYSIGATGPKSGHIPSGMKIASSSVSPQAKGAVTHAV